MGCWCDGDGAFKVGRWHVKYHLVCHQMGHLPTAYVELVLPFKYGESEILKMAHCVRLVSIKGCKRNSYYLLLTSSLLEGPFWVN